MPVKSGGSKGRPGRWKGARYHSCRICFALLSCLPYSVWLAFPVYEYAWKIHTYLFSGSRFYGGQLLFSRFRLRGKQGAHRYSTTRCLDSVRAPWWCFEHPTLLRWLFFSGCCVLPRCSSRVGCMENLTFQKNSPIPSRMFYLLRFLLRTR